MESTGETKTWLQRAKENQLKKQLEQQKPKDASSFSSNENSTSPDSEVIHATILPVPDTRKRFPKVDAYVSSEEVPEDTSHSPTAETKFFKSSTHKLEASESFSRSQTNSVDVEGTSHVRTSAESKTGGISQDYIDEESHASYESMTRSPIHSHHGKGALVDSLPRAFINLQVETGNLIYSKVTYSQGWMIVALVAHVVQFFLLLTIGTRTLSQGSIGFLAILAIIVTLLLLFSRWLVHRKSRMAKFFSKEPTSPDDETDDVPPLAIYSLMLAVFIEGVIFAIYGVLTAGTIGSLDPTGFFTSDTTLQIIRFASITLMAFHRIVRPANRIDPMRTFMELEVVSVCWDALDGSTVIELVDGRDLNKDTLLSAQVLIVLWYISVGARMAIMIGVMLPPTSYVYSMLTYQPFQFDSQPTVDRTMQGLRIRSSLILGMTIAEFYAAGLRITLWSQGQLDSLQQDIALKNILFLSSVYQAYTMRQNTIKRDWNDREIIFGILLPRRPTQLRIIRWVFVISYLVQGVLLSSILALTSSNRNPWAVNIATDVLLVIIFLTYCRNVHIQSADSTRNVFLMPKKSFVFFPSKLALVVSTLMMINMYAVRVPALYYHAVQGNLNQQNNGSLQTYNSALLIVNFSIIVIGALSMYWAIAFMLFKSEFTVSPGNYNAIHDPTISMVSSSIQIEAALDILSATTLMSLATYGLPPSINGACALFSLLEIFNAYQSFGLQIILSGGHDDTPADLVKWKAFLRSFRFFVDFATFILRVDLWIEYKALSSVFLIKNLYNLLNTFAQVERSYSIDRYPESALFTEFVPPAKWYGMSKEAWRVATRTSAGQAQIAAMTQSK